ncbi:Gfo/Idh/MocA family protein [Neotamlana laminarinivorans]|uniref:Gfo/Idh/MocA family oxidoreductase n=1 Tax=Neotamlana laminarinivorans TaxID=2883124 RepID=A0A9X1I0K8_9FLAO|nr:Gfo/Idh/MocA family oxidoreductase [Tamlana laminarinivorans]MCB4797799.1 Gfo/Idh/MocA family oxidoreductase [Tamlana laminarinivorans]
MSNKIKWGIIGLGNIANKFAKDLLTINDAELYAVASRSQNKAEAFATEYGAKKAYANYQDLANDTNIDAVYIATPHVFHKENSIMCLKKGIAVLCEKPFAMNANEVEDMITSAKANNTLLMEALWTYFLPHYQFVLNEIKNKTYGALLKLEADFGFTRPFDENKRLFGKHLGGGSLLDIGIYPIFAALSTLGKPKQIDAKATFFDNGVDSSCSMVFKYNNNVEAHLKSSLIEKLPTEAIFTFTDATIKINTMFHQPSTVTIIKNGIEETKDFGYKTIGYNFEAIHFNTLLKQDKKESNIMSFDFSRNLIKLLDTVRNKIDLMY